MFANTAAYQGHRFLGFAVSTAMNFYEAFEPKRLRAKPRLDHHLAGGSHHRHARPDPPVRQAYSGFGMVGVYFNNALVGTLAPNSQALTWQSRSFTFVAPASSGFLEFRAQANPNDPVLQGSYMGIDGIEVVPEPASFAALEAQGRGSSAPQVRSA
ncbi:MAG: hypothetical protein U0S12_14990 [Fimbriimonadales bacterium]